MVSVGGWLMEELGKLPETGDTLETDGCTVRVTVVENHRATSLLVTK